MWCKNYQECPIFSYKKAAEVILLCKTHKYSKSNAKPSLPKNNNNKEAEN